MMERIENLTSMAVFACVAENLSFTETAHLLNISKSSVSREISNLEKRLGSALLKRTTRKIEITELGLNYYQYCFKILNELRASEKFVKGYYEESTGTLTILAPVTFGTQYVVPILSSFLAKNIHVNVELDLSDKAIDIKDSNYDLAIVVSQDTPNHEHCKFLCTMRWGLYATPNYIEQLKPIITPADLPKRDYILFRGAARVVSLSFKREKQKISIDIQSRFRSNNSLALISMALSGRGIAYLPNYIAREILESSKLIRILPDWVMDEYKIWILSKTKYTITSGIKRFSDELQERISATEAKDNY